MRLKVAARKEQEWGEAEERRGPSPLDTHILTSLFSALASLRPPSPQCKLPPPAPPQTGSPWLWFQVDPAWFPSSVHFFFFSWAEQRTGLRWKQKSPVISVLTCEEEISQWNKNGSYKGKRRQRDKLGEEAKYKTSHISLLDSDPRACFIPMTHSITWRHEWGKDVIPVDLAQGLCFPVTQRPYLSHPPPLSHPCPP